jgi:hypothetical protein
MLAHDGTALNFNIDLSTPIVECQVCTRTKIQGLPIAQRHQTLREKGEREHTTGDLWGPPSAMAKGSYKYYDTHLDAGTELTAVYGVLM